MGEYITANMNKANGAGASDHLSRSFGSFGSDGELAYVLSTSAGMDIGAREGGSGARGSECNGRGNHTLTNPFASPPTGRLKLRPEFRSGLHESSAGSGSVFDGFGSVGSVSVGSDSAGSDSGLTGLGLEFGPTSEGGISGGGWVSSAGRSHIGVSEMTGNVLGGLFSPEESRRNALKVQTRGSASGSANGSVGMIGARQNLGSRPPMPSSRWYVSGPLFTHLND